MHIYLETEPRMYNWMFWKPRPIPCVLESSKINSPLESGWPFSPFHWQICLSERGEKGGKHPTQHAQLSPHHQQSRLKWHPHLSLDKRDDVLKHTEPSPSIPAIPQKKRYKKVQTESQRFKTRHLNIEALQLLQNGAENRQMPRCTNQTMATRTTVAVGIHHTLDSWVARKFSRAPVDERLEQNHRGLEDHFPWVICMVIFHGKCFLNGWWLYVPAVNLPGEEPPTANSTLPFPAFRGPSLLRGVPKDTYLERFRDRQKGCLEKSDPKKHFSQMVTL